MLPESSRMNMMFGSMLDRPVPSGSVAMVSSPDWTGPAEPNAAASAITDARVLKLGLLSMAFLPLGARAPFPLFENGLDETLRIARPQDAHSDAVINGHRRRKRGAAIGHDTLGAAFDGTARAQGRGLDAVGRRGGRRTRDLAKTLDDEAHLVAAGIGADEIAAARPVEVVAGGRGPAVEVDPGLPARVVAGAGRVQIERAGAAGKSVLQVLACLLDAPV